MKNGHGGNSGRDGAGADALAGVPTAAPAVSGSIRTRVRYCECDPMGVVHHAAYIPWLEMGRTELLRSTGVSYAALEAAGVFLVIVRLECRYKRPGRYDDVIEVRTRVSGGGRVKIEHEYEVLAVERAHGALAHGAAEVLMTGATTLACVDAQGRPRELPEWLVRGGLPERAA